jgi:hypothetical protein
MSAQPTAPELGHNGTVLRASHVSVEYGGAVPTRAVRDVSIVSVQHGRGMSRREML